jgi:hypothetical protein
MVGAVSLPVEPAGYEQAGMASVESKTSERKGRRLPRRRFKSAQAVADNGGAPAAERPLTSEPFVAEDTSDPAVEAGADHEDTDVPMAEKELSTPPDSFAADPTIPSEDLMVGRPEEDTAPEELVDLSDPDSFDPDVQAILKAARRP